MKFGKIYANLKKYHHFVYKIKLLNSEVDSHDEIHYFNGWIFEKILQMVEGIGYDLKIGEKGENCLM